MYTKMFPISMLFSLSIFASQPLAISNSCPIADDLRFSSIIKDVQNITTARQKLYEQKDNLTADNIYRYTTAIQVSVDEINDNTDSLIFSYPAEKKDLLPRIQAMVPSYPYTVPNKINQALIQNNLTTISQVLGSIFSHDTCGVNFFNAINNPQKDIFSAAQETFCDLKQSYEFQKSISAQYNTIIESDITNHSTATAVVKSFLPSCASTTTDLPSDLSFDLLSPYKPAVVGLLELMKTYCVGQQSLPNELTKTPQEVWQSPVLQTLSDTSTKLSTSYSDLASSLSTPNQKLALDVTLFQALPSFVKNIQWVDVSNKNIKAAPSSCVIQ